MGLLIDLHVHTSRYSRCSDIDPARLVDRAIKAGLQGLVITEHARQWDMEELHELAAQSRMTGFLLMAGFEYATTAGHMLVYGVDSGNVGKFAPGLDPVAATRLAEDLGGVCIAAHPTRAGECFDGAIASTNLAGIEICSCRMENHEQRLAAKLAKMTGLPPVAGSDSHTLADVGKYATEFDYPIQSIEDLKEALRRGRFRVSDSVFARIGIL